MSDYLGYIVWYTIGTPGGERLLPTGRDLLHAWCTELGLDPKYVPKAQKSIDAFRAATTRVGPPYVSEDGHRYKLVVREYKRDAELVYRQVMRQGLDPGTTTIRVADLKYFRARRVTAGRVQGSEDVQTTVHRGLGGTDRAIVQAFVNACMEDYKREQAQFTPNEMRVLIRQYLRDLGGVPLPDASAAYIVPEDALTEVRALQQLTDRLSDESSMRLMPVVDDREQRDLLQLAIDTDVDERAQRVLADITQWQDAHPDKVPGSRTFEAWRDAYRQLQILLEQYGGQHDLIFPAAADTLESLHVLMSRLTGRMAAASKRR